MRWPGFTASLVVVGFTCLLLSPALLAGAPDVAPQVSLARTYLDGKHVNRDYRKAAELLEKAARSGDKEGQYLFAVLCYNGKGTTKNDAQAAKWFQRSADQGHPQAQLMLGMMLLNGEGVNRDEKAGVAWTRKAATQGSLAEAQYWMGRFHEEGTGDVDRSQSEALRWYHQAAEQGNRPARMRLLLLAQAKGG